MRNLDEEALLVAKALYDIATAPQPGGKTQAVAKMQVALREVLDSHRMASYPSSSWRTLKSYVEGDFVLGWYVSPPDPYMDMVRRKGSSWFSSGDPMCEPDFWMPLPEGPSAEDIARMQREDEK